MKKISYSLSRTEAAFGWSYFIFQLFLLPVLLALLRLYVPLSDAVLNFVFFAVNFGATTIIFRKLLLASVKTFLDNTFHSLRSAGQGLLLYYALSYLIGLLFVFIAPDFSNVNDENVFELIRSNYTLMAVGTVLLVPVAEELLFRGLIFGSLQRRSRIAAYTVSTLAFSLLHVVGYIGTYDLATLALCFVQYIPASVCLAWAYESSDSILTPILIHMAVNQISMNFL